MIPSQPFQRRLTVWAVLCLLAAPLLYGVCWLDTAMAGQSHQASDPFPYASADAVRLFRAGGTGAVSLPQLLLPFKASM